MDDNGAQIIPIGRVIQKRKDQVALWLAEGLWPRQAALRAHYEFGCSRKRAARYVALVLAELTRDAVDEPLETRRQRQLLAVAADIKRAQQEGQHSAVASLRKQQTALMGLEQPAQPLVPQPVVQYLPPLPKLPPPKPK